MHVKVIMMNKDYHNVYDLLQFSCCGLDNSDDFVSGNWNTTPTADIVTANKHLTTPLVCCTETVRSSTSLSWWNCAVAPLDAAKSNYKVVCTIYTYYHIFILHEHDKFEICTYF